jgi:hypothetical protein
MLKITLFKLAFLLLQLLLVQSKYKKGKFNQVLDFSDPGKYGLQNQQL